MSNKKKSLTVLTSFILFQNLLAQSKAMEADMDNEIEKTKQEGVHFIYTCKIITQKNLSLEYRY